LYEAELLTKEQIQQAEHALNYLYQTLPSNMKSLLFSKAGSEEGAYELVYDLVMSKVSSTRHLTFDPKNQLEKNKSKNKGVSNYLEGLDLTPAELWQQGYGERERILFQDGTSTGMLIDAVTASITKKGNEPMGSGTLEDVSTSQFGGLLNFTNASMGGQIIPFEGRRNIAIDGSKIYSMYLPYDKNEYNKGNIVPDLSLINKVNNIQHEIRQQNLTDTNQINQLFTDANLPVYYNEDGSINVTEYK
jgi:hypothetical protein